MSGKNWAFFEQQGIVDLNQFERFEVHVPEDEDFIQIIGIENENGCDVEIFRCETKEKADIVLQNIFNQLLDYENNSVPEKHSMAPILEQAYNEYYSKDAERWKNLDENR